jgi:hypothetical protein
MHKTIIVPVLYGHETWFLGIRELSQSEHVWKKVVGGKNMELRKKLWQLHNEEFHNLYSSDKLNESGMR